MAHHAETRSMRALAHSNDESEPRVCAALPCPAGVDLWDMSGLARGREARLVMDGAATAGVTR